MTALWARAGLTICTAAAMAAGSASMAAARTSSQPAAVKPAATAPSPSGERNERRAALAGVKSWAIQLRFLDRAAVAAAPIDMIVIDHAPHPKKDVEVPFTAEQIAPMKMKPDGSRRIVLAYLSIGEAERYRYYWKPEWDAPETRPAWLGAENPRWPGDYYIDFASPDWQSVIFGRPESYLDRIMAAGFDGVFLDRADAFQDVEATTPGAEDAMAGFVSRLADHAHRINPKFLVVMQNAEELARSKSLLARLDGMVKEDLSFGHDDGDGANPEQMVRDTVGYLRQGRKAGLKIFVLEYPSDPVKVAQAANLARREGFTIHFTDRMLGTLSLAPPAPPSASTVPAGLPAATPSAAPGAASPAQR